MSRVDLARLQFATTSLYHFLFVPFTIGMACLIAIMQTAWHRTGKDEWYRLTRFFGRILLIGVAVGVATGLVQEFQFGMNWSAYSRFVGDVFGAPLAIEGLAAFFLESTFLGIWYFGWGRLSPRLHLATIYLVAIGTILSAAFILAANSWMQDPTGYSINPETGRAQLESIGALFTEKIFLWALPHTLLASIVTAAGVLLAVSCWHLLRSREAGAFRRSAALALVVLFPAVGLTLMTGARLAVTVTELQPMKTAAMEALWNTEQPASFSLFQIGGMTENDQAPTFAIEIPHLLSVLATNSWDGEVEGMNEVQADSVAEYGEGSYVPMVPFSYWGLRVMAYLGMWMLAVSGVGLLLLWRRRLPDTRWYLHVAVWSAAAPFLMNTGGWLLAETGRQPWIVWGLLETADAESPSVSTAQVAFTLGFFLVLYAALTFLAWWWIRKYGRRDLDPAPPPSSDAGPPSASEAPVMSY
ncbi:MAG: cytochrome ubiquinol oxidase subunit I [Acidimicrobiia bacterium]|nr:cytochrome ubiquinol oxidase subunit I [Acidimicrobiia bacterium]